MARDSLLRGEGPDAQAPAHLGLRAALCAVTGRRSGAAPLIVGSQRRQVVNPTRPMRVLDADGHEVHFGGQGLVTLMHTPCLGETDRIS